MSYLLFQGGKKGGVTPEGSPPSVPAQVEETPAELYQRLIKGRGYESIAHPGTSVISGFGDGSGWGFPSDSSGVE